MALTQDQLGTIRIRLEHDLSQTIAEIQDLDHQVQSFGAANQDASYGVDNHLGDQADVVYEQERLLSVRDRLADRQVLIERALVKMNRGDYGYCENCGQLINPARLEALPFASYCITCQEKRDRGKDRV